MVNGVLKVLPLLSELVTNEFRLCARVVIAFPPRVEADGGVPLMHYQDLAFAQCTGDALSGLRWDFALKVKPRDGWGSFIRYALVFGLAYIDGGDAGIIPYRSCPALCEVFYETMIGIGA